MSRRERLKNRALLYLDEQTQNDLGVLDLRLLDAKAADVQVALEAMGVEVPTALHVAESGRIDYHPGRGFFATVEGLEKLWESRFRDVDALGEVNKDKGYSLNYVLQLSRKSVSTTRIWEYGMEHLKIAE